MSEVSVVDLGTGNLFSVLRGLERSGGRPVLVTTRDEIVAAPRLVLPGVGSFADAASRLDALDLRSTLHDAVASGVPLLGICLGMQLLFDEGEEDGLSKGLGLIPGRVVRLAGGEGITVPHVGWQRLDVHGSCPLVASDGGWFYFSHSFRADTDERFVAASVEHGEPVPAVVQHGRVFGIQPHPEKSGADGNAFLRRFLELQRT